jgi:hypothetical protein
MVYAPKAYLMIWEQFGTAAQSYNFSGFFSKKVKVKQKKTSAKIFVDLAMPCNQHSGAT